jgi:hypothetical protein
MNDAFTDPNFNASQKTYKTRGNLRTRVKPATKQKNIDSYSSHKKGTSALKFLYLFVLAAICLSAIVVLFKLIAIGVGAFLMLWVAWTLLVSRVNR